MISIIVPAYNAEATIERCLQALSSQTAIQESEIVVVSDGSTDRTGEIVRGYPEVRLLEQENQGPAAARNLGAREARGTVLLFTDADCAPLPDWAEQLSRPIVAGEAVGTKGTYRTDQRSLVARFVQQEYEEKYARMARDRQIDFIDTYSAGYSREIFVANGGFDTIFPSASVEDQEFSFRLARQGLRMVFVPAATVVHRHADTVTGYARKKFRIGFWKALVSRRYPEKMVRDSHTPQSLKLQLVGLPLLVILALWAWFWPPAWWAWGAVAVAYLLSMLPLLARIAARDPAALPVAPLLVITRALALGAGFAWGVVRFWFGEAEHVELDS